MKLDITAQDTRHRDEKLLKALNRSSGWVLTVQISDRDDENKVDTWQIPLPEVLAAPTRPGAEAGLISGLGQWLAELASTLKERSTTAGAVSIDVTSNEEDEDLADEGDDDL